MKRIVFVSSAFFLFLTFVMTSCKSDDKSKQIINIVGNNLDVVVYKSAAFYTDPCVCASDDLDGEVEVITNGNVSMRSAGEYIFANPLSGITFLLTPQCQSIIRIC